MLQITHTFRSKLTPSGNGVAIDTLTVTIWNARRVTQEVLGPITLGPTLPSWLTRIDAGGDVSYQIDYALDESTYTYTGGFVILRITATKDAITFDTQEVSVALAGSGVPTPPTGREPYADIDYANAFFLYRLDNADWSAFSDLQKQACLMEGSDDLDTEVYKGRRSILPVLETGTYSARKFPRIFDEFQGGLLPGLDPYAIPEEIKQATCLQAMYLGRTVLIGGQDPNRRRNLQNAGVTGVTQGRSAEQWDISKAADNRICASAYDLIRRYLATSATWGFRS